MRKERGLYKRNRIWWFTYQQGGKQLHRTTKSTCKEEARQIRELYINNINITKNVKETYIFDLIVLKFLEQKTRILRPKSLVVYKSIIRRLLFFFSSKNINDLKKIDIKNYENIRLLNNCSDGCLLSELKLLKEIFNFAFENELIEDNIFLKYKFTKIYNKYEPKSNYLTPEECQRLINACNVYMARLVIVLLETGLRINEGLTLLFEDIARNKNNVFFARIKKENSKSKRERFVPLSILAMEQINKQKIEFPNSYFIFTNRTGGNYSASPLKTFVNAKNKAGIDKKGGFHLLRHTFASLKIQGLDIEGNNIGVKPIELISEILGHQSIDLTKKVYAKYNKDNLIEIF